MAHHGRDNHKHRPNPKVQIAVGTLRQAFLAFKERDLDTTAGVRAASFLSSSGIRLPWVQRSNHESPAAPGVNIAPAQMKADAMLAI
jgi:hypothetical protein